MKRLWSMATAGTAIIIVLAMLMSACTRKNNLTGNNFSGLHPQIATSNNFGLSYSFTQQDTVTGSESYLLCGNNADGIETTSLLQFSGLPESIDTILVQPTLKLYINGMSAPMTMSLQKVAKDWVVKEITPVTASDLTLLVDNIAVDTTGAAGDSVVINLSNAMVENWKVADLSYFNLALKWISGGWTEFKSTELKGPVLDFTYKITGDTTTYIYKKSPTKDTFMYSGTPAAVTPGLWELKNTAPQRIYTKFNLPEFRDVQGNVLSANDLKRMTINRAELVMFIQDAGYYTDKLCYFYPLNVTKADSLETPTQITLQEIERITNTVTSYKKADVNDSVSINITAIVQGLTSGKITENKGLVIINTAELSNYGTISFYPPTTIVPSKQPYVKIYYTQPYLAAD